MVLLSALGNPPNKKKKKKQDSAPPVLQQKKPQGPCDKCDGPHDETVCPYFKGKQRETHTDALVMYEKKKQQKKKKSNQAQKGGAGGGVGGESDEEGGADEDEDDEDDNLVLGANQVRVVGQPGDGSCLFHSLSHGLRREGSGGGGRGTNASDLRRELEDYIAAHPNQVISGTPIETWVMWDSQASVVAYTRRMRTSGDWGGAIEIAVCATVKAVEVHVFERRGGGFVRISRFLPETPASPGNNTRVVRVLYGGRCHYDAIELA